MADEASETFGGGVRNFLGAVGFISALLGGEQLVQLALTGAALPWWASTGLIIAGLPIFLLPWVWKRLRGAKSPAESEPPSLEYLHGKDSDLGAAIRDMVWCSAWGKCYASHYLAHDDHKPTSEWNLMMAGANVVRDALKNGELVARGRKPGQMDYEVIPREHWFSTGLWMNKDDTTLWKMVLTPTGGAEITPSGDVIGRHAPSVERTQQLAEFDSLIVDSYQFEKLWPRRDKKIDAERKRRLKMARKAGADPQEIAKLWRD